MKFIVRGTKYEFDQRKLTFAEARAVQKVTGRMFGEIAETAEKGDMEALQAMTWVAMKRVEPTAKFSDLDDLEMGDWEAIPDPEDEEQSEQDPQVPGGDGGEISTPSG